MAKRRRKATRGRTGSCRRVKVRGRRQWMCKDSRGRMRFSKGPRRKSVRRKRRR